MTMLFRGNVAGALERAVAALKASDPRGARLALQPLAEAHVPGVVGPLELIRQGRHRAARDMLLERRREWLGLPEPDAVRPYRRRAT